MSGQHERGDVLLHVTRPGTGLKVGTRGAENGSQADGLIVNAINVLENKSDKNISSHIPPFLQEKWYNTVIDPSPNTFRLNLNWSVGDFNKLLAHEIETGGILSPEAVFIETGDHASVPVTSGTFTWHRHNEEPCTFSVQDWCSFILSSSLWSMLITPRHYRTYVKIDNQKIIKVRSSIVGYSNGKPSTELSIRRLNKFVTKQSSDTDLNKIESKIGRAVGISVGPINSL